MSESQQFNLYSAGKWEIFSKNFIAGMGRALGSMFIYLLLLLGLGALFSSYLLPQLQTMLQGFTNTLSPDGTQIDPRQLQQLFNQLSM
jgi:hypothetical protein